MTKEEILKRVKKFQGANREFSQELPPIIEGLIGLIDEAGPEVVNNLTSNSPTKALSANMGKELKLMVDEKVSEPETAGTAGQILQLDEEGVPEWVDAAEVGATYDSTVSDTSTNAIQNKTIKKYVDDNFAQKDGYYSSLTAGAAENLVGRGSVPAEIAFRTSGGDQDLGTGAALITKILGRTEAFNQLVPDASKDFTNTRTDTRAYLDLRAGVTSGGGTVTVVYSESISAAKKVAFVVDIPSDTATFWVKHNGQNTDISILTLSSVTFGGHKILFTANVKGYDAATVGGLIVEDMALFDLTLEGLGLTTVDQFRALHPLPYYNYNAGVLKNNAATGLETVGFNQWDEVSESGAYDTNGQPTPAASYIRSKNPISAFPNTTYYLKAGSSVTVATAFFYDAAGNFISYTTGNVKNATFATPSNCHYIHFCVNNGGTTYNHDICINLSWSGYRNGEYEPYEEHTLALPLNAIACHDEDDNAVVVNGLDGVGSAYDEAVVENGYVTKIIKRFAKVTFNGTEDWQSPSAASTYPYCAAVQGLNDGSQIPACNMFVGKQGANAFPFEGECKLLNGPFGIAFGTSEHSSTVEAWKAYLAGLYSAGTPLEVVYPLATPLTLTVDEPFAASYYVNDFGTEARLPQDTADVPQAPFCAEIQYAMNATDTIRRLPSQYISDESMTNILTALKTAGIIADFTLAYDSEHQYFTCSVTAPTTEGE